MQGTAAATAAWLIATHVIDHHEPFFAPIAAVIALNAPLGERGLNALRLPAGVVVGIAAGEAATRRGGDGRHGKNLPAAPQVLDVTSGVIAVRVDAHRLPRAGLPRVVETGGRRERLDQLLVDVLMGLR